MSQEQTPKDPLTDHEIVAQLQMAMAARGLGFQHVGVGHTESRGVVKPAFMFYVDPVMGMYVPNRPPNHVKALQCRWVLSDAPPECWAFVHRQGNDLSMNRGPWEPIDTNKAADRVAQYMAVGIYNTARLEYLKKDHEARKLVGDLARYLPEDAHGMVGYSHTPSVYEVIERERWLMLVEKTLSSEAKEQVRRAWLKDRNVRLER